MNDEMTDPVSEPTPDPTPESTTEPVPARAEKVRVRDRVFGLRALAGVAAATLIIGAGGGALVGAAVSGDDGHDRHDRHGRPEMTFRQGGGPGVVPGGPMGQQGGPGFAPPNGQLPPGTAPQDDEETQPDSGTDGGTSGQNSAYRA